MWKKQTKQTKQTKQAGANRPAKRSHTGKASPATADDIADGPVILEEQVVEEPAPEPDPIPEPQHMAAGQTVRDLQRDSSGTWRKI